VLFRTAEAYWKAGGVVTISAHLCNPANPKGGGWRDKGVDLAGLPGTVAGTGGRTPQPEMPFAWRSRHESGLAHNQARP